MATTEDLVLHIYPRFPKLPVPSINPSCLKLETYARMARIPYKVDVSCENYNKKQMPWVQHRGKIVADSSFCVPYLNKEFAVDLERDLSDEQKATATAFTTMLEEHTSWTLVYHRWLSEYGPQYREELMYGLPSLFRKIGFCIFKSETKKKLQEQGMGKHSEAQIYDLAERDLRAASKLLGTKPYLFGDVPVEADAALFGVVANVIWTMAGSPQHKVVTNELPNLVDHAQRIKKEYYPDWEEVIKSDTFDPAGNSKRKNCGTK